MKFKDQEIEKLDMGKVDDIIQLLIEYFCGEKHHEKLSKSDKELLTNLLKNAKQRGLNYEQFNEILLLSNQERISEPFFRFFFKKGKISLDDLKNGVTKFRGFALLCFGNFRFAYKNLIQKNKAELEEALKPYCQKSGDILKGFKTRLRQMLEIEPVMRDETWYLGNISKLKLEKEYGIAEDLVSYVEQNKKAYFKVSKRELLEVSGKYIKMQDAMINAQEKALKNTTIYLTWDYMDVYVATSMRHKWEFQETFDFIKNVFNDSKIKGLKLRYFDPTQSLCKNRIDKGLIEGLMLKRILCSIYMAQESDTMGKDSELASTLAQGKPVIAYIPRINIDEYAQRIKEYPLDYFEKRLLILQAEEIFDDKKCINKLESYDQQFFEKITSFQKSLDKYRESQPLSLWQEKEEKFKINCGFFINICKILAIAEHYNFEKRADVLKKYHPLAIQVDLKSGVANGVLVVRSIKDCAKLLYQILVNNTEFKIKHVGVQDKDVEKNGGVTILEEKISGCPFRVVTDDEKLTNSFWNFYLT